MMANEQATHLMIDTVAHGPLQYQEHSYAVTYREGNALLKPGSKACHSTQETQQQVVNSRACIYVRETGNV